MIFKLQKSGLKNITNLIIGGTGSGKTTFTKYCMSLLNDNDTRFYGFLGGNSTLRQYLYQNGDLTEDELGEGQALSNIFKWQRKLLNIKNLIFEKRDMIYSYIEHHSSMAYTKLLGDIKKCYEIYPSDMHMEITVLHIRNTLFAMNINTEAIESKELKALISSASARGYNVCIIVDDASGGLETLCRSKTNRRILMDIITKGRHYSITLFICSHTPNAVNDIFRTNARNIIWCQEKEYEDSITAAKYPKSTMKQYKKALFRRPWDMALYNKDRNKIGILRYNPSETSLPAKVGVAIPKRPVPEEKNQSITLDDLVKLINC